MKYYFNFITRPDDGAKGEAVSNTDYTFPTDPMYKQDGVYNQRCKYKISNFSITELTPQQAVDIAGQSLIIRFNNLSCMNSWSLISFGGANKYKRVGQNNIEFHIRLNDDIVQQTGGTTAVVQTLTSTVETVSTQQGTAILDATYKIVSGEVDGWTIPTNKQVSTITTPTGKVSTLTTPAVGDTETLHNTQQNFNTFTEEMIGMPCWGEQVDLSYFKYGDGRADTNLNTDDDLKECNIVFTLEVEPIAIKL